jgi:hypothetical protein
MLQNIYTISDYFICPEGEGEGIVHNYLEGLFSRLSNRIISLNKPVDWLVVKSDSLEDVTFSSSGFFEEMLESKLQENNSNFLVFRYHAIGAGGNISNANIEKWVYEHINMQEEQHLVYLNNPYLNKGFVGYHLDMRNLSKKIK